EGAMAAGITAKVDGAAYRRATTPALTSGSVYVAMRSTDGSGVSGPYFNLQENGTDRMQIRFYSNGLGIADFAVPQIVPIISVSANQWYVVNVELNDLDNVDQSRRRVYVGCRSRSC